MKIKLTRKSLLIIGIVLLVVIGWSLSGYFIKPNDTNNYNFAKCLTEKGATMYGAEWCGHCKNQKEMFGESFKYVNYVECPENQELCNEKGIRGYPTWIVNEVQYTGAQQFERLSELTGCSLS